MRPQIGMHTYCTLHMIYVRNTIISTTAQCCKACKRGRFCDDVEDHFLSDKSRDKHYVLNRNSLGVKVLYTPNKKTKKYLILIKKL